MENGIKTDELKSLLEKKKDILLLDVRRKNDYQAEPSLIPGAEWRDPEDIAVWSETIPKAKQVVIYCVKGGSVSKSVSDYLRNRQIGTSYLEGGFMAWKDSGGRVMSVSDPDSRENYRKPFNFADAKEKGFTRKTLFETEHMRFSIYMILPGHENPLHRHPGSDEILFFSNGTGECIIGDKTWPVENGVVLFVPKNTPHAIKNTHTSVTLGCTVTQSPLPCEHVPMT